MAAAELLVPSEGVVAAEGAADAAGASLLASLAAMRRQNLHCDAAFVSADGARFSSHCAVLAASSQVLRERLAESKPEIAELVLDATHEAVQLLVDFIYEVPGAEVGRPATFDVNREVLSLAKELSLPGLTQRAAEWLAKDVTTANVVEKLRVCREFGLETLHGKIIERLLADRTALAQVSRSAQIVAYPELLRELLQAAMRTQPKVADPSAPAAAAESVATGKAESEATEQPSAEDAEDVAEVAEQPAGTPSPDGPAPKKRQRKGRGRGAA